MMHKLFFLFAIFLVIRINAQDTLVWRTILSTGDSCRYLIPRMDMEKDWINLGYNDSTWIKAVGGIGFGDNDDSTILDSISVLQGISTIYERYHFNVHDINAIECLILDVDYDDGFVAYLNGSEIARANVNDPVKWDMTLSSEHEANMYLGNRPERFILSDTIKNKLIVGDNVLSIEIHNDSASSSDLTCNVFVHVLVSNVIENYKTTPSWFWEPQVSEKFTLPLVVINTNGKTIVDEPKIIAHMGVVNNESKYNFYKDPFNGYDGLVGIEIRGESSQQFEKKSYSIKLLKLDSTKNNVSLLGLPSENDFVLYAPYSDKTLLRNVLSFELYRQFGAWAPRTRFVELIVNNDYKGVYVLTEKIKVDKNRVKVPEIKFSDTSQIAFSGGYIMRRDKITDLKRTEYWTSPVKQVFFEQLVYQFYDPEAEDLTKQQISYVKNWMRDFDVVMSSTHYNDPVIGYSRLIDKKSFIYMLFLNELSKGIDGYMFSSYFYKKNIQQGGQLVAGPPWDYDLTYGNLNYAYNEKIPYTHSWVYDNWSRIYWWKRLMEDSNFENDVHCKWDTFRNDVLSDQNIVHIVDSCVSFLGSAISRNFERFPILGKYIWPNAKYPETYKEEIENLKSWTLERTKWMDGQWANRCIPTSLPTTINDNQHWNVSIFPNPSDFSNLSVVVRGEGIISLELIDMYGRIIEGISNQNLENQSNFVFSNHSQLPAGIYLCKISNKKGIITIRKIIKK